MAHIHHRDGNLFNNDLDNIVLVTDPCEDHPAPDEWGDPRRALADAFDLIESLSRNWEPRPYLTAEEIVSTDARTEEMRRRVTEITGEER